LNREYLGAALSSKIQERPVRMVDPMNEKG
jgi:hypothetical protein